MLSSQEGRQDPPALGSDFSPQFSRPLLTTPGLCKISASPTPCPVAAGCYGEGLYPRCGGLSIPGWGRRKSPEMAAGEKLGNFTAPSPLCQQNYPYRRAVIFQQCKYFLNELEGGGPTNVVLLENITELGREMAEERGGSWGSPARVGCTQKHLALLHQTEAFESSAFNSAVCAPCWIYYSAPSFFSLPRVPAINKMLMPLLALAPRGWAQSIPSARGEHGCGDRATVWAMGH